ncbi:Sodium/calcium exchanger domain containing protein [Tylopilus felleus]
MRMPAGSMPPTGISQPRPASPESATLVVLQAYGDPTDRTSSSNTASRVQSDTDDTSPLGSPNRSELRLSAISCSSTVNLVSPHPDNGPHHHGEFKESPFRWNYPSLPDLPLDQQEIVSENVTNNGKQPAMRLWEGWRVIICCSWLNFLLLLIPVSWICRSIMGKHHKLVFISCIISMIPLAKLHDLCTRELAMRFGGSKTGLLNASMSNTVELVIAITALQKCELRVVQSSLIGSILSKLLLILGMCFFAGGLRFSEQGFDQTANQVHSSLLSISVGALLLPAAYHFVLSGAHESSAADQTKSIMKMSHGVSIVLLFIYACYLLFQFWSHQHLYKDTKQKSNRLSVKIPINPRFITERRIFNGEALRTSKSESDSIRRRSFSTAGSRMGTLLGATIRRTSLHSSSETTLMASSSNIPVNGEKTIDSHPTIRLVTQALEDNEVGPSSRSSGLSLPKFRWRSEDEVSTITEETHRNLPDPMSPDAVLPPSEVSTLSVESLKEPRLSLTLTLLVLIIVTILTTINAEELVESMDGIAMSISKQYIGLILLPAVSSIAECVTAMNVSVKDQLGLSVSVAVGSAIQMTLFIIPLMVTLGWTLDKPLALLFDPFESIVLYISVQTMSYVVADGKSNWLDGAILISLYVIIAVSFWYYPGQPDAITACAASVARDS